MAHIDHGKLYEHDIENPLEIDDNSTMRIDGVQSDTKLIHMKKTRQINKRPPSFRFKTKGEKIEDADSLLPLPAVQPTAPSEPHASNGHVVRIPSATQISSGVNSAKPETLSTFDLAKQAKEEKVKNALRK